MFNTSIYDQNRSYGSGVQQGVGLRSGTPLAEQVKDEKTALDAIKAGGDKNIIIAELQKVNPSAAQNLIQMLGIGYSSQSQMPSFNLGPKIGRMLGSVFGGGD